MCVSSCHSKHSQSAPGRFGPGMKSKSTDPTQLARKKEASQFRGVSPCGKTRFRAQIFFNGQQSYIGCYKTAAEAAVAYDRVARKVHGERAKVNFPLDAEENRCSSPSTRSDGEKCTPVTSSESDLPSVASPGGVADVSSTDTGITASDELASSSRRLKPKFGHSGSSSYDPVGAPFAGLHHRRALAATAPWPDACDSWYQLWCDLQHQQQAVAAQWVHSSRFGSVHNAFTEQLADEYVALSIRCDDIERRMERSLSAPPAYESAPPRGKRSHSMMY